MLLLLGAGQSNIAAQNKPVTSLALSWVTSSTVFHSKGLNHSFPVSVSYPRLPVGSNHRLNLLLFLDGQHVFSGWNLENIKQQMEAGKIRPAFILGLHSTDLRNYFYTPTQVQGVGGSALAFLRFLGDEFIPHFELNYPIARGKINRTLIGASHGALLALYQGILQSEQNGFANIIAFSPTIWWDNRHLFQLSLIRKEFHANVFLHSGGKELNVSPHQLVDEYNQILKGFKVRSFHHHLPEGEHKASTWAIVLPQALQWIEKARQPDYSSR